MGGRTTTRPRRAAFFALRPPHDFSSLWKALLRPSSLSLSVLGEKKVGCLNMGNRDIGSDDINQAVDTREIISRAKPDLLSRLKSAAAGGGLKRYKYA